MTTEISDQTDTATATATDPRHEAALARIEEVVRQASAPAPPPARAPQHAGRRSHRRPRRRLPIVVITVALLVVAAAGAVFVARGGVHRQSPTSPVTPRAATSAEVVRLETATSDALSALAAERAGLASLTGIPTPAHVAPITDGYAASLRLYAALLTATPTSARAKTVTAAVRQQVRADATRLQGVAALPPALLGAFLEDTTARATRLEGMLHTLQHDLASPAAR